MRKLLVLALAALTAFIIVTPSAMAAGTTKVTIQAQTSGFFGEVKSNKDKCANGRKVRLFKVKSGKDKKVGSDIAQPNGDGFMWSIGANQPGDYYAKAGKADGCEPGKSKTIPLQS